VIVTIIADNYFGYSKKEIKSHISYSANLFGGAEEEHAGGALAFPRYNLGEIYLPHSSYMVEGRTFADLCRRLTDHIELKPEGYAVDRHFPEIIYVPEDTQINIHDLCVSWQAGVRPGKIKLLARNTFVYPSGFRVHMERHPDAPSWRLIGTIGEGTFCHKPSTVSGGGKSEISKSIAGAVISGPTYVSSFEKDMAQVRIIFEKDYSTRFRDPQAQAPDTRSLLSKQRSLGSVVKLLTPSSEDYNDAYNQWLENIPQNILALVFMIKRFYRTACLGNELGQAVLRRYGERPFRP